VGQAADELRSDIEPTREDMAQTLAPRVVMLAAGLVVLGLLLIRRRRHGGEGG
jgi:MYXO-CTERM domain-containing protein